MAENLSETDTVDDDNQDSDRQERIKRKLGTAFQEPSKKGQHPGKNLGKYLHSKKSIPAEEANHTVDANTGGAIVRPTQ